MLVGQQGIESTLVQKTLACKKILTPGEKNIIRKTLVDPKMIYLRPLEINLGLMKQFAQGW